MIGLIANLSTLILHDTQKDMSKITELYAQFNFSHNSLFTIGHSISATEMKGVSSISDIPGIAFEATEVDNLNNFKVNSSFEKKTIEENFR